MLDELTEIKQDLVSFVFEQYSDEIASRLKLAKPDSDQPMLVDEAADVVDRFLFNHRTADGLTVIDKYLAARPLLAKTDQEILTGWKDPVEQPFRMIRRVQDTLVAKGLVDDLTYRIRSNGGIDPIKALARHPFFVTRIVPIGKEWMLSGATQVFTRADRDTVFEIAYRLAQAAPQLAFRNPDLLASARKMDAENRQLFIEFFGSDMIVVPGNELSKQMAEYWRFRNEKVLKPETAARAGAGAGPNHDFSEIPELIESESVAIIYDQLEGLGFYANFGLVAEVFADPDLLKDDNRAESVEPTKPGEIGRSQTCQRRKDHAQ